MSSAIASIGNDGTLDAITNSTLAVAAPVGLPSDVAAGLRYDAIETKLRMESTLDDVFEQLSDVVESNGTEAVSVPDAIFMKLSAQPTGTNSVTVPMLRPLQAALTVGEGSPLGNEETQRMKYAKFYYGEFSHAVPSANYGKTKNEADRYGLYEKIQPMMSKFIAETRGQRIREASIRGMDRVVVENNGITDVNWNSNWFVPNTDLGDMPVYDSTAATFTSEICSVLDSAAGTDGSAAVINTGYLDALAYYAPNVAKIDPIMLGGKPMYVVMVPSTQVSKLGGNVPGQMGDIFVNQNRFTDNIMKYNGVIGVYKNLLLVEDMRYAEGAVDAGSAAIQMRYLYAGNNDLREKTVYASGNKNWDFGMLYGNAALCEWVVKDLHFEEEVQNYNRKVGHGVFGESGISLVEYDVDSPLNTTRTNCSSIVLPFATPSFRS